MVSVKSGLDVLLASSMKQLKGQRVGILCHQASVDSRLRPILSLLHARDIQITALFGPEHGLWGTAQDQIPVVSGKDPILNVPVYSLYGDHRAPSAESLE